MRTRLTCAAIAALLALHAADAMRGRLMADEGRKADEIINSILDGTPPDNAGRGGEKAAETAGEKKGDAVPSPVDGKKDADGAAAPDRTAAPGKKTGDAKEEASPAVSREEEVLYRTGVDFFHNGMYDHSYRKFQDLLSKFPQGTFKDTAHFWMGKIEMRRYRYDEAIKEFSSVTAESGDYPAALYHIGESHQMKGAQISSIEFYQRVYAQFPAHELADDALLTMGKLYLAQEKGGQAIDAAMKIMKYYKDRETVDDAFYLMGKVYERDPQMKDPETARRLYRQFLKRAETDERFGTSPLRKRVQEELRRIETTYFKMER